MQDTLVSCWPSRNVAVLIFYGGYLVLSQFQWPYCLKHGSAAVYFLGYGFESCQRNAYLSVVSTVCCLYVGLITCAEESYPECGISDCDRENLLVRMP